MLTIIFLLALWKIIFHGPVLSIVIDTEALFLIVLYLSSFSSTLEDIFKIWDYIVLVGYIYVWVSFYLS